MLEVRVRAHHKILNNELDMTPMKRLIKELPDVAAMVLNTCIAKGVLTLLTP